MNELTNRAKFLLSQVSALNKKHEEIARITGRKFNVFSILGAESTETSTHSAFLVELLNPKGSHGQGSLFLNLFIKMLEEKKTASKDEKMNIPEVDMESALVRKEVDLGKISDDWTKGGRADIVINHPRNSICIENKIYAQDQKKQLIRYYNYYVNGEKGGLILYLTLYGSDASRFSTHSEKPEISREKDKHYFLISYSNDILEWLIKCQSVVIDVPTVRDVIGQYIYLIKKLTGQGMDDIQKKELIDLVTGLGKSKEYGQENLIRIQQAFNVFLKDVGGKLRELQRKLNLSEFQRMSATEIWDKEDQLSKLNSVLYIPLKPLDATNDLHLKIRLSPIGWTIEFWNTNGLSEKSENILSVGDKNKLSGKREESFVLYETISDYETSAETIGQKVEEIVKKLYATGS